MGTNLDNGDLNVGASYGYGGFRQGLRVAASRAIGERGGFRIDGRAASYKQEDWSATVSTSIPFEARPNASWSMSLDYDVDVFRAVREPMIIPDPNDRVPVRPVTDYVQAGAAVRAFYSRTRGTTYGLGAQYGFDASVSLRLDHPALGATYRNLTVGYSSQYFRRLWGQRATLALRLGGSLRVGDLVRGGSFSLGGVPTQDVVRAILDSTRVGVTGYLRGYPARVVAGNQVHLLNAEYRHELWAIERGIATLPVYVAAAPPGRPRGSGHRVRHDVRARAQLQEVARRGAAARCLLRLLHPRHVRAGRGARPRRRGDHRELAPAHREPGQRLVAACRDL